MKSYLISTLILLLSNIQVFAQEECRLFEHQDILVLSKKLTPNWAHEYSGADLVRNEIKNDSTQIVKLAIFDLGFEKEHINLTKDIFVPPQRNGNRLMRAHHGTSVASLINGAPPYGTTDNIDLINLTAIPIASYYRYQFIKFEKSQNFPKIISNSLGWQSESVAETAKLASEKNILWFLAAGNDWPNPVRPHELNSEALLVGSYAPSGLTSYETQSDPRLLIHAPANTELPAINGHGERYLFGATSGATPQVAGLMANIASLLPQITPQQTRVLIQKTGLDSAENKLGFHDAPKLLNSYKAYRVAKKLVQLCPQQSQQCVDQQLTDSQLYQFETDTITCSKLKESNCSNKKEILSQMRKQALLGNQLQLQELSCAYEQLGYTKNSEYYSNLSRSTLDFVSMRKQATVAINKGLYQISYYRYIMNFDESILETIIKSENLHNYHKEKLIKLYNEPVQLR